MDEAYVEGLRKAAPKMREATVTLTWAARLEMAEAARRAAEQRFRWAVINGFVLMLFALVLGFLIGRMA